jgi:hypothetical protein
VTGDEITCENCGGTIDRRGGQWVHDDGTPRCWPGRDFYAIPEFPEDDER